MNLLIATNRFFFGMGVMVVKLYFCGTKFIYISMDKNNLHVKTYIIF